MATMEADELPTSSNTRKSEKLIESSRTCRGPVDVLSCVRDGENDVIDERRRN